MHGHLGEYLQAMNYPENTRNAILGPMGAWIDADLPP